VRLDCASLSANSSRPPRLPSEHAGWTYRATRGGRLRAAESLADAPVLGIAWVATVAVADFSADSAAYLDAHRRRPCISDAQSTATAGFPRPDEKRPSRSDGCGELLPFCPECAKRQFVAGVETEAQPRIQ
jgi:hypothetical protein